MGPPWLWDKKQKRYGCVRERGRQRWSKHREVAARLGMGRGEAGSQSFNMAAQKCRGDAQRPKQSACCPETVHDDGIMTWAQQESRWLQHAAAVKSLWVNFAYVKLYTPNYNLCATDVWAALALGWHLVTASAPHVCVIFGPNGTFITELQFFWKVGLLKVQLPRILA